MVIADSGCTDILLKNSSKTVLDNLRPHKNLVVGTAAHNQFLRSTHRGDFTLPTKNGDIVIPAYVFADNTLGHDLAGLSPFCNAGCKVELTATDITISKDDEVLLQNSKSPTASLWHLDLSKHTATRALTSYALQTIRHDTNAEYVQFTHAVFGSHPVSSFQAAVDKGWLGNYPRITGRMVRQNPPVERATAMGYLDQSRQGQRSTKRPPQSTLDDEVEDPNDDFLRWAVLATHDLMNSSDATGRFPIPTKSGYEYILVSTLGGYVHLQLLKSRSKAEYVRAYKAMYAYYEQYGHKPTIQRLDNESSTDLETFLRGCHVETQFVPPGIHRQNPSERAIRHTKNCIIAMCVTADPDIPANILFEEVVPQAEVVINQLRPWARNPTLNAWTGFRGREYDHLAHPMSIFGMKVVIHEKPDARASWAPHGKDGFYLGPALEHYRAWRVYVSATGGTRVSDTLAWFPDPYKMPGHSPLEQLNAAVGDLLNAVSSLTDPEKGLLHSRSPLFSTTLSSSLQQLKDLFQPSNAENHSATSDPQVSVTPVSLQRVPSGGETGQHKNVDIDYENVEKCVTNRVNSLEHSDNDGGKAEDVENPTTTATIFPAQHSSHSKSEPLYIWTVVNRKFAKKGVKYFRNKSRMFRDEDGIHQIVDIERNSACSSGKGSQTLFYKYFNVTQFITPPTNVDDYDHIPCAELHQDAKIEWISQTQFADAYLAGTSLNLNADGTPLSYNKALKSDFREEWLLENDVEIRKLITTTETMRPIHKREIPTERRGDVTYYNPVCKEKMKEGKIKRRVRGTMGGDRINYPGNVSARTASLEVVRTLLNSVLADDADFFTADITDYYLGTPLLRPEYLRIATKQLSDTIVTEYNLNEYCTDGYVYFEVVKGMYGLPQAGLLAQQRLVAHLAKSDYIQSSVVPCLFRHPTNGVTFVLVVDDFGVKFTNPEGQEHFLTTLRNLYSITVDAKGSQYLGMAIEHDKKLQTITISMPGYIARVLERFKDWAGTRLASTPGVYRAPNYGAKVHNAYDDDTAPLSAEDKTTIQEITGSVLYYARAVDPLLLTATNEVSSAQAKPTERVKEQVIRLLQFARANPNNCVVFRKSKMHFILQTDASYLSRSKARSVAGGIGYFGDASDPTTENGMVYAMSSIIDVVVGSVGEAEYGAGYMNAREGVNIRNIATALGHEQPPTPLLCDNEFAIGLANDTLKQKRSKSIDMRFHWLRDRVRQGQFRMIHLSGKLILADYFTKALPKETHRLMAPRLVHTPKATTATADAWHCARYRRGRLSPIPLRYPD